MKTERQLKQEIFRKVKEFFHLKRAQDKFFPGVSRISYGGRVYDEQEMISLIDASLDFWLTQGKYAAKFESELAKFVGVRHCLLVNSGSSANLLAVTSLTSHKLKDKKLNPGDEVITTACGFPTTLNPIIQNKLIPVFVDIELGTYNIDVKKLKQAITKKTKAVVLAHTLGNPANLKKIIELVDRYGLWFVEDNSDALGSKYNGNYTGSFGHVSTSSFYPSHHITMGEGGAVLTNDALLAKIILSLRDWGRDCFCKTGEDNTCGKRFSQKFASLPLGYDHKYVYSHIGYNLKATDMQAAIGVQQLKKLPGFIKKRQENFKVLYDGLKDWKKYFLFPRETEYSLPSWFGFPLLVRSGALFKRNDIVLYLEKNKISTRMLFGSNLLRQPAYKNIKCRVSGSLENSDLVMNNLFWIGLYPGLGRRQLDFIIKKFKEFFKK